MLWCDKYRPSKVAQLTCHPQLNNCLKHIAAKDAHSVPHLLFYGPSGGGKRTRIRALLRDLFHVNVHGKQLKLHTKEIQCTASKKITITVLQSAHHIEVTPSDSGLYDRYVVANLVKELAQSVPLSFDNEKEKHPFKVIVLNEADRLTHEAQAALRRTMEMYTKTCRMVLCASSTSKVIGPVKSRCLCLRVPLPQRDEIGRVLQHVSKEECLQLPPEVEENIVKQSNRNLRRALMLLEATKARYGSFESNPRVQAYHWETFLEHMAKDIVAEQSPKRLLEVRDKVFKLTTNCVPAELILQKLVESLVAMKGELLEGKFKHTIVHIGALYEHRMKGGSRPMFHIEAFVARFMSALKAASS